MTERNLLPQSVYLSPEHIDEANARAREMGIPVATLLRLILLGKQKPLSVRSAR